jgi:hypothetical protein
MSQLNEELQGQFELAKDTAQIVQIVGFGYVDFSTLTLAEALELRKAKVLPQLIDKNPPTAEAPAKK